MPKIVAFAGGVGGAKLAEGLARAVAPADLTIVVNTGDDLEHFGLHVSPDLDTVCYTLAGLANSQTGWGQQGESWRVLEAVERLGGPAWFHIGDLDLATHLERTRRLREGQSLSQITADFCRAWGIQPRVLPMSDQPVHTMVATKEGELPFQEYFVHRQCQPEVSGFRFAGVEMARPAPGLLGALEAADIVVFCPSNPWVSIDPILAVPGVRAALETKIVVAVSPIVGGQALKGPAAKMFHELGIQPSPLSVAHHYGSLLTGLVIDQVDQSQAGDIDRFGIISFVTNTIMSSPGDRTRLAEEVLVFGEQLCRRQKNT